MLSVGYAEMPMVDRGPGAGYGIADLAVCGQLHIPPEMLLSSDVKARYQKFLEGSMSDGAA